MKTIIENAQVVEEKNVAITDYHVEQATPISPPPYTKSSRGWFNQHEGLRYQIETERKKECFRCEARKI